MYAADAFCFCRTRLFLNNASPEKQADAPDCSKSYKAVDYSCDNAVLPAANPGYKVKFKKTDKTPVKSAYYVKDQCYSVDNRHFLISN